MSEIRAEAWNAAEPIRQAFSFFKQQQTNRPYRPAARFRNPELWSKAAEICIREGADPYSFVKATFMYSNVIGGPFPQQLCGEAAARCYREYRKIHGVDDHSQQDVYANEISKEFTSALDLFQTSPMPYPEALLSDTFHSVPDYVRIYFGKTMPEVWAKYGKSAKATIFGNQRLINVLRELSYGEDILRNLKDLK